MYYAPINTPWTNEVYFAPSYFRKSLRNLIFSKKCSPPYLFEKEFTLSFFRKSLRAVIFFEKKKTLCVRPLFSRNISSLLFSKKSTPPVPNNFDPSHSSYCSKKVSPPVDGPGPKNINILKQDFLFFKKARSFLRAFCSKRYYFPFEFNLELA